MELPVARLGAVEFVREHELLTLDFEVLERPLVVDVEFHRCGVRVNDIKPRHSGLDTPLFVERDRLDLIDLRQLLRPKDLLTVLLIARPVIPLLLLLLLFLLFINVSSLVDGPLLQEPGVLDDEIADREVHVVGYAAFHWHCG